MSGQNPVTMAKFVFLIHLVGLSFLICADVKGQPGVFPLSLKEGRQGDLTTPGGSAAGQETSETDPAGVQNPPVAVKSKRIGLIRLPDRIQLRVNQADPPIGKRVQFEAANITGINAVSFRFIFGDGLDSDWIPEPRVSHVYDKPGDYQAVLFVREASASAAGRTLTRESEALVIHVHDIRVTLRILGGSPVLTGQESRFEISAEPYDSDMRYLIVFGDGQQSGWLDQPAIDHRYAAAGTYRVVGGVGFDLERIMARDSMTVKVSAAPVPYTVRLELSPEDVQLGQPATFAAVLDPGSPDVVFGYEFGDGAAILWTPQRRLDHVYQSPGEFRARVTASIGDLVVAESDTVTITVSQPPAAAPVERFAVLMRADPVHANQRIPVRFRGEVQPPGRDAEYQFVFGDDNMTDWSPGLIAEHEYARNGTYRAYVRARRGPADLAVSNVLIITIEDPPPPIPWGGLAAGLFVLGGGVLLRRSIRARKMIRRFRSILQPRPRPDHGIQDVESGEPFWVGHEVRLRPVADQGKQEIEAVKDIVIEERREG